MYYFKEDVHFFRVLHFILATPEPPTTLSRPCSPSPCGINAYCRERDNTAYCECLPDFRGNPYESCQPECLVNTDCSKSQACIRTKCQDPCPGTCGVGAICTVSNHIPICSCPAPTIGNAFTICQAVPEGILIFIKISWCFIKLFLTRLTIC